MKRPLVIVAAVLAWQACHASPMPDFPFVYATGSAKVEVSPDKATISFSVKVTDPTSTNALAIVAERSKEVLDFLANNQIKKRDIRAYEVDKSPMREEERYGRGKIIGYEVSRQIGITLHDLNAYETVIRQLLSMQNVVDINTGFDRTDREKLEADLTVKACADAKASAERMAKGFGATLGGVHAVSENQDAFSHLWGVFTTNYRGVQYGPPENKDFLFVPSTIELRKTVNVVFKIKGGE